MVYELLVCSLKLTGTKNVRINCKHGFTTNLLSLATTHLSPTSNFLLMNRARNLLKSLKQILTWNIVTYCGRRHHECPSENHTNSETLNTYRSHIENQAISNTVKVFITYSYKKILLILCYI
jgi:hypothetical protein